VFRSTVCVAGLGWGVGHATIESALERGAWHTPHSHRHHTAAAAAAAAVDVVVPDRAVPTEPGRCRLINRNAFRFVGGGLVGTRVVPALMRAVPGWMIHLGTQVQLRMTNGTPSSPSCLVHNVP